MRAFGVVRFALMLVALAAACNGSSIVGGVDAGRDAGPAPCPTGRDRCGAACVDLTSDTANCGACGTACGAGRVCAMGRCALTCPMGQLVCGDRCVDPQTDLAHCGACGAACPAVQVCSAGACSVTCGAGLTRCGGAGDAGAPFCANVQTDRANCGACGTACGAGQVCVNGGCRVECVTGQTACGDRCVDVQTDRTHCGGCGTVCPAGQVCSAGACQVSCAAGLTNCQGTCRDLQNDRVSCGACGASCAAGQVCSMGACQVSCGAGLTDCGGVCRDVQTDRAHCGACGNACPAGQTCAEGRCGVECPANLRRCGDEDGGAASCVDAQSDRANCGACGNACAMGATCTAGRCVGGTLSGPSFQVDALEATGCRVIDHETLTGDDRGGIAISNTHVFYAGDTATGRFDLETLAGASLGRVADAMVSNLRTGAVYTLANGTTALSSAGGMANALIALDGATGALTSTRVTLSQPIPLGGFTRVGVFSGWDRAVIFSGGRAYHISLPDGAVIDLGAVTFPSGASCENSWFYGVAEYFGGALYVDYVQSTTAVARTRLPDGMTAVLSRFTNLSDMCSFTVSPTRRRWYFHHESSGQFGGSFETLGYCNAQVSAEGLMCPAGTTLCGAGCRNLQTDAAHCGACGNACAAGAQCIAGACRGFSRYTAAPAPPEVAWVDVCGAQRILASLDDSAQLVAMPFAFPYWGTVIAAGAQVNVSTNGFLSLDGVYSSSLSGSLPLSSSPNGVIAPQWRDLVTGANGVCLGVVGAGSARRWVVQWPNVRNYTGGGDLSFEVILHEETGIIDFVYATMTGAQSATAGIESPTGSAGVGACGSTLCTVASNTRVRFTPEP